MTREYRKTNGICAECNAPATDTCRCDKHAKLARERHRPGWRERRAGMLERKIAEGICFDCPKKAVVGKRRCNEHLVRASEYQVKYKTAPPKARIIPLGHCQCGNAPMTGRDVCWCCDQKRAAR